MTTHAQTTAGGLTVAASCELMTRVVRGSPVGRDEAFHALQDASGRVLIFSIGTDGRLWVVHASAASPTGWDQTDLAPHLTGTPRHLAAVQAAGGAVWLALATETDGVSAVYVAGPLPDAADTPWSEVTWRLQPAPHEAIEVSALTLGAASDGQGAPILLAAANVPGGGPSHFLVPTTGDGAWIEVPPPENAKEILQVLPGSLQTYGRGLYTLYRLGGAPRVVYISLDNRYHVAFDVDPSVVTVATSTTADGSTDLFAAGAGAWYYPAALQRSPASGVPVVAAGVVPPVVELVAPQGPAALGLWLRTADGGLYQTSTDRPGSDDPAAWRPALPFRGTVQRVSPLRNRARQTMELVVAGADGTLTRLFQEPSTSVWQTSDIPIHDTGTVSEELSYTTRLTVRRGTEPLFEGEIEVEASEWVQVTANGAVLTPGPGYPVSVEIDPTGSVSLSHQVATLSSPVFTVIDGDDRVEVHPYSRVADILGAIPDGAALKGQKLPGGAPLLPPDFPQDKADRAIEAVHALLESADALVGHTGGPRRFARAPAPRRVPQIAPLTVMHVQGRVVHSRVDGPIDAIVDLAGNVLEAMWSGLKAVGGFAIRVVDGVANFLVQLGEQWFRFALDSVQAVLQAIDWVLQHLLDLALDVLSRLLGMIFDWEQVKRTHAVIANVGRQVFGLIGGEVGKLADAADGFLEDLEGRLSDLGPLPEHADRFTLAEAADEAVDQAGSALRQVFALLDGGPLLAWAPDQLLHNGVLEADLGVTPDDGPLVAYLDKDVIPAVKHLVDRIGGDVQRLVEAAASGALTPAQILEQIGVDLLIEAIATARLLVRGFLGFVEMLVAQAADLADLSLDIPLLSGLYRRVVGSKLTVLDAFALLLAIPTNTAYAAVTGRFPFQHGTGGLDTMGWEELFATLKSGKLPAATTDTDEFSSLLLDYSWLAGLVTTVLGILNSALGAVGAVGDFKGWDSGGGKKEKLMKVLPSAQLCLSAVQFGMSFPMGDTRGWGLQLAAWIVDGLGLLLGALGAVVPFVGDKAGKVLSYAQAGLGLVLDLVQLGLAFVIEGWEVLGIEGPAVKERILVVVAGIQTLLGVLGDASGNIGTFLTDPRVKLVLALAGVELSLKGWAVNLGRDIADFALDEPHLRFTTVVPS